MSDLMLLGILRMPPECWDGGPMDVMQRHAAYLEAAERLERMKGCRICGGLVDLQSAVAPSVHLGGRPPGKGNCALNGEEDDAMFTRPKDETI